MTFRPEDLAAAAVNLIALDPPPSEEEIDRVLKTLCVAFSASADAADAARRLLHARFAIRMEVGQTLVSQDLHEPWLGARRASIEPYYWDRYRQMLIKSGWSPLVVATLDRSNDELLDLLGDPVKPQWRRRGLVVGDVQSGKTASYAALICKAADAGYRMIILLTGVLEIVRRQTQKRLDAAFVGLDSRDFLMAGQVGRKTHTGVGLIDQRRDGIVFTSHSNDFRKATASALTLSLDSVSEPVLVVTKKNKLVLQRLASWLRARNSDRDGRINLPLLLIDDEADNASINTRQSPGETTAINHAIRDLLSVFSRSSYVGFTATPFANIFIDPASTDEMVGDDLFPRHFIHVLEPPTNYVGMDRLFRSGDPETDEDDEGSTAMLRTIEDEEGWLPVTHKKDAEFDGLPESLRRAVRAFLIATTIRDLRALEGVEGEGGGIHRSMLVNVSRFTNVQNRIADTILVELNDLRRAVRLYGKLAPRVAAGRSPEIAALQVTFDEEFADSGFEWRVVLNGMLEAIAPVEVRAVNQSTGAASLDYSQFETAPGLRVIAVGGNSLSRGLTLEGLSTSYFLRNARAYDTLLQMGRWFGYRDGYPDLCRLWLTSDAESWYRHVADATAELKRDFARMRRQQATPSEFGLRVRTHPDTLLITARNKMATGINVVGETRDISLVGRGIESARLYSDERRNQQNLQAIETFLSGLADRHGRPVESPHGGAVRWTAVDADDVATLVERFLVHPLNHDFQGESIAEFLRDQPNRGETWLDHWTVAILTTGKGPATELASLPGQAIRTKERRIEVSRTISSLLISGRKARVGSRTDVRHGMSVEQAAEAERAFGAVRGDDQEISEDYYRGSMNAPLLLVYLVSGYELSPEREKLPFRSGAVLPALALHFPGAKDPDAPRRLVRYRLNRVAQAEYLPAEDLGDEELPDEPDPDD